MRDAVMPLRDFCSVDVAGRDDDIHLAAAAQHAEQPHAHAGAGDAAKRHHRRHLHVDRALSPLRQRPRHRRCRDVARRRRDRDGGRNAAEDQQGREKKSTADAEQAGEKTDRSAQAENEQPVDRHLGDGQVDFHRSRER
jgi:hypothetical protein